MSYKVPVSIWNQVDAFRRFLKKNGTSIKEYRKLVEARGIKMEKFLTQKEIRYWILGAFDFQVTDDFPFWWDLHWKWKKYAEEMWEFSEKCF